jgi:hypothetical protein
MAEESLKKTYVIVLIYHIFVIPGARMNNISKALSHEYFFKNLLVNLCCFHNHTVDSRMTCNIKCLCYSHNKTDLNRNIIKSSVTKYSFYF